MKNVAKEKKSKNNNDCIFCKIIAGEVPCEKVYENDQVLAFKDISCDFPDHTLVIPKRHCENILDASPCRMSAVAKAVREISHYFVKMGYDGVNIVNNSSSAAGQTVMHLHFHIIPRKKGDGHKIIV